MSKNTEIEIASTNTCQQHASAVTGRRMLTFTGTAAAIAGLIATHSTAHDESAMLATSQAFVDTRHPEAPSTAVADRGTNNADAELIHLCEMVVAGNRELQTSYDQYCDEIGDVPKKVEARQRFLVKQGHELSEQAADMRATTLEGLRAKAAALLTYTCHYEDGEPIWANHDERLGWSMARDLVGQDRT